MSLVYATLLGAVVGFVTFGILTAVIMVLVSKVKNDDAAKTANDLTRGWLEPFWVSSNLSRARAAQALDRIAAALEKSKA